MSHTACLFKLLDQLIDRWCERRALRPLAVVLAGYPRHRCIALMKRLNFVK
jgi:hypothetical protein